MRTLREKCDVDMVKMEGGEDQFLSVVGRHLETRAESIISANLETISAAERTGGLPCVNLGVGEEVAGAGAEEERRR